MVLKTRSIENTPRPATTFEPEIPFLAGPIPLQVLVYFLYFLFRLFVPVQQ